MKKFMYHNQIVHHKLPCFNLFILHNNLFDNQGSDINKYIFCSFPHTVFYENFLPTLLYSLSICIIYILYPLHSCDYLKKILIKINVATDEGNSRNET